MEDKKDVLYAVCCITEKRADQFGDYSKDREFIISKIKELNNSNKDKSKRFALLTVWSKE